MNRAAPAIALAICALAACACASSQSGPPSHTRVISIEEGPHHPPPFFFADLTPARTSVSVEMEFPHPGWSYILDHEQTTAEARELYFTIYRPDPKSFFPMVIKRDRATYDLDSAPEAIIYARTIDHDLRDVDKPYRLAAEAR